ncbi:hypothetical protein [Parasporobacterium paucivorans]|uniref:P22 coat protein-gene protein 5 n=1 Tax=Parasporobacterium paucivorans DSM 15970 TaxID=1122934 RepID=A0A1M6B2I3_9FIRM|nr:hypothetical protein [Parasporobacterium paucivorans]SHI42916.1 hypothetical protein SAMN02745691_00242 [Parasporobacterium paucivorans DSM 15970]
MAHTAQERYSKMVKAKVRKELVLKDGVVFNNDYEGSPAAGSVKIPVRDTEVAVSDYDKAAGITGAAGSTSYETLVINKDKAVNEIIDGYDAASVPDNLVADRLDSAGYSLAAQIDTDGATTLVAGATVVNESALDNTNIYGKIVDIRTAMSKANIPNDGKRYLLVTPDSMALVLKSPEFISASSLGDEVKESGVVGKIANFNVIEWNDTTANLSMIAGHPRFATRAEEFAVPVHIQDLSGSGTFIGASAVQGRDVYGHKVLRSAAIRAVYSPGSIAITVAIGTVAVGDTKLTVTAEGSNTLAYKKNPATRVTYGLATATYAGTAMTSGAAKTIGTCAVGDIIEVVEFDASTGLAVKVGYVTLATADIKLS